MTGGFIGLDDPRWLKALETLPHDVYHRPEYVALCAREDGGEPIAFHAEHGGSELLVPLLVRPIPGDGSFIDATAPYGYASPLTNAAGPDVDVLLDAFSEACRERGIVSVFLRLHPLLDFPLSALNRLGTVVRHGRVVAIDLRKNLEQLSKEMKGNHRRSVQTLVEQGFDVRIDDWSLFGHFIESYYETMKRVSASRSYYFSRQYFDSLQKELQPHVHFLAVCASSGEFAGGGIFFATSGIMQYHLSATVETYLAAGPSKLMLYEAMRWGQRTGHRVLHLGGGVGGREDSLFQFKARFASESSTFPVHTCRLVIRGETYDALVQSRPPVANTDFFPLYRA